MTVPATALKVKGLTVAYNARPVLWNVDLEVPCGAMMGVIGPNGAGKSTLLKSVLGIVTPIAGRIEVLGKKPSTGRSQIGYVPQRTSVDWDFPITVMDLVLMGTYGRLGWFRRPGSKEKREAIDALNRVEMTEFANRQIGELSGGQQQRVFLARAFVQDAPVYFLDEPFAAVDATTEKAIVGLLHELKASGKTLVIVHHDLTTVAEYFDHVALINREAISSGPLQSAFTPEFLEQTYGGPMRNCGVGDCSFTPPEPVLLQDQRTTSKSRSQADRENGEESNQ